MTLNKRKIALTAVAAFSIFGLAACQTTQKSPEWVKLSLPEELAQIVDIQYDINSINKHPENKNWRYVNVLTQAVNPATSLNEGIASTTSSILVDCENSSMRIAKIDAFSERDAAGEAVQTLENPAGEEFRPVTEAMDQTLFDITCKK